MHKIAVLVIYNHRYDKNIAKVENLYGSKFSHIYHVVPFYDGTIENVIPVYESSYHFQSYIAQAYQQIRRMNKENYTHYFVTADDILLNPSVNESNLLETLGLSDSGCYINHFTELSTTNRPYVFPLRYNIVKKGVEVGNILPRREQAIEKFKAHKLNTAPIKFNVILNIISHALKFAIRSKSFSSAFTWLLRCAKAIVFSLGKRELKYPLLWGYSDLLIVDSKTMPAFCNYNGAFAATDLFVEFSIPTSLVLSADKITVADKMKGIILEAKDREPFENSYHLDLKNLQEHFPDNTLFIHPVKLSKWK